MALSIALWFGIGEVAGAGDPGDTDFKGGGVTTSASLSLLGVWGGVWVLLSP